ncbi:MAG: hypothetical protein QNK23_00960 [Crocinitomicaceae bacterium]|nr:hypothetical protein [Crocinitomicaceae bacterium]
MAEHSKEWCDLTESGMSPDFSVLKIFSSLESGYLQVAICEGFGFTHILNQDGDCYVVVDGKEIPFETLTVKQ